MCPTDESHADFQEKATANSAACEGSGGSDGTRSAVDFSHEFLRSMCPTALQVSHPTVEVYPTGSRDAPVVYFVRIGRYIKIGHTTDLRKRLRSFATSYPGELVVLLTIPGGRQVEKRLHDLLALSRLPRGEFFHNEARLDGFIRRVEAGHINDAWVWLDQSDPRKARAHKEADQERCLAAQRMKKAEMDAYCARLVAERKRRIGW